MAINKNFVIKNGVEVNTNLLVGDSTLNKVGIATTVPGYTLHIGVGDGARGGIGATDITVTGIATIGVANSTSAALSVTGISTFDGLIDANGGVSARTAAVQDLTDNRVVIAGSGGELEDSANLTFDGSTLTVSGDLDPTNVSIASTLEVTGVATFLSGTLVSGIGTFDSDIDAEGTVTVGTGITLQPHGGASFAGIVTVGGNLLVTGDYVVDEIEARNLNLTGIATIPTLGVTGIGTFEKLTVGTGVTLQEHGGVSIAGITTIGGRLNVHGTLDGSEGALGDIQIGVTGATELDTSSGNLTIDSAGGTTTIDDDVDITGDVDIDDTTQSTNTTTGALKVDGGVGIAKNVNIGGALDVDGATTLDGLTVAEAADFSSDVDIDDTTQSTSTTTGALKVDGGVGVVKNLNVGGETVLQAVRIAGVSTISDNVNISGVTTTGENLGGFKRLVGAASSTVVSIAVTVATKTSDHRYFDQGSPNGYWLDGVQSPFLTLVPGKLYYFDQSHSTNSGHPLRFYLEQDKANAYTTEITTGGSPGSSGAYTQIGIGTASNENNHPAVLHYQCSAHALMGNAVATQSNTVNLPDAVHSITRGGLVIGGNLIPDSDDERNIGAAGSEFKDLHLDGTANIDTLAADTAAIGDLTDNRVVIAGSSGELEDDANLTFDGTKLNVGSGVATVFVTTGNVAFAGFATVGGGLHVGSGATIGGDLVPLTDGNRNLGSSSKEWQHLFIDGNAFIDTLNADTATIGDLTDNRVVIAGSSGALEDDANLTFDGTKLLSGVPINVSTGATISNTGNAAFAGIVTANGGLLVGIAASIAANGNAVITGIATLENAYITKLATSNGTSGSANEVAVADGSGSWNWQPVNTTGAGDITGITVKEEGSNVGTANSITILNFVGSDVTADAAAQQGICTITVSSSGLNNVVEDTTPQLGGNLDLNSKTVNGTGSVNITGIITANQFSLGAGSTLGSTTGITTFIGDGSQLTGVISGIGITEDAGTVGSAITTINFTGSGISTITADSSVGIATISISGGGGGGVSETSTSVSSTSATNCGSFAISSKRSASILAQITQGSAYQVGRYLVIHDDTTVTTIEESAVATGSMLGTFEGVINGSNLEFRVTMSSSSNATVITKIDSISA